MLLKLGENEVLAWGTVILDGSRMDFVGEKQIPKCTFTISVKNHRKADGTYAHDYLDCVMWGRNAERQRALHRGDSVLLTGQMRTREWEGRDGETRTTTECVCEHVLITATENAAIPLIPDTIFDAVDSAFAALCEDEGDLPPGHDKR
jgi:single-strand DNA-binding protein